MIKTALNLPAPTALELATSERLLTRLRAAIPEGVIDFAQFMAAALYTPELGYYAGAREQFGAGGDFVTAPELTPVFSYALTNQVAEVLSFVPGGGVAEFGGGSGVMASDILHRLAELDSLPPHYVIIEISATLRERQRAMIAQRVPALIDRVQWLDALPAGFRGIVLGNEILDALPVHRLRVKQGSVFPEEIWVDLRGERLQWLPQALRNPRLIDLFEHHYRHTVSALPDDYYFELCPALDDWLAGVAQRVAQGVVILIDYGQSRAQLFHPERTTGTLACHYRHRMHDDALWLPGQQDITAHVDFTRVAEVATAHGLDVCGYTHQAGFLLGCGIEQFLQTQSITARELNALSDAKKLLMPDEMGETFNVIGLSKDFESPLRGFTPFDRRARL